MRANLIPTPTPPFSPFFPPHSLSLWHLLLLIFLKLPSPLSSFNLTPTLYFFASDITTGRTLGLAVRLQSWEKLSLINSCKSWMFDNRHYIVRWLLSFKCNFLWLCIFSPIQSWEGGRTLWNRIYIRCVFAHAKFEMTWFGFLWAKSSWLHWHKC